MYNRGLLYKVNVRIILLLIKKLVENVKLKFLF
jgi:hypothetical protein